CGRRRRQRPVAVRPRRGATRRRGASRPDNLRLELAGEAVEHPDQSWARGEGDGSRRDRVRDVEGEGAAVRQDERVADLRAWLLEQQEHVLQVLDRPEREGEERAGEREAEAAADDRAQQPP